MAFEPDHLEPLMAQAEDYLAGGMSVADRAAFEAQMARDPALREMVEAQRSVDQLLRSHYTPPVAPVITVAATAAGKGLLAWLLSGVGLLTSAGALVLVTAAALGIWRLSQPPAPADSLGDYYTRMTQGQLRPLNAETDALQLGLLLSDKLAHTVRLKTAPGVSLVGAAPATRGGSPMRLALVATFQGEPVVVLMEPGPGEMAPDTAPAGVHQFPGRVGSLRVREISKLDHAVITPLITSD